MRFTGFIGPSYTMQSVNVDCQRCVNLYPEIDELGTGNEAEVASLVSTPGLKLFSTLPTGPVRGTYTDSTGQLWAVGGNVLYSVNSLGAYSSVGTLNTSTGPVSMKDNGFQLVIVDGPYGYQVTLSTNAFAQITDTGFLGATLVDFIDGYFVYNKPNSQQFYCGPPNAVTPFSSGETDTAEAGPDNITGLICAQEMIYILSQRHAEIWYDVGSSSNIFGRIQGAVLEIGCPAAFSIAKIQSSVFFLGQDQSGQGIVYRFNGMQPQRISTHAIERVIAGLGDLSLARAWTYTQGGHSFYCLNLPGATSTWCFDQATNLWHERTNFRAGVYSRHLADCSAFAYQLNIVGDYSSGNLYTLDAATYTDNGATIIRERTAPHISKDDNRLFHSAFLLDMERGVGTDGTNQGNKPQAILSWSNDGGHSWSNERLASVGAIGSRYNRVKWFRLGQARDRVYKIRISDPVKVTLLGAELEMEAGVA